MRSYPGLLLLGAVILSGCSSPYSEYEPPKESADHLLLLGRTYAFAQQTLGHPPKNVEELEPFLAQFGDADDLLCSPVDGTPYVIIWGTTIEAKPTDGPFPPAIAYDGRGREGKRFVLTAGVNVFAIPEGELRRYLRR